MRRPALVAAVGVLAIGPLTLGACGSSSHPTPRSSTDVPGAMMPGGMSGYYAQKLTWSSCDEGECASLRVPLDYAKPAGPSITLAVNRMKATGTKKGSLVVNPGGPGGSGVDYAAAADQIVGPRVRKAYDIVGFDPRGVQRSAAITCVDDAQLDAMLGSNPSPSDAAEESETLKEDKAFAAACAKNAGPLLGHVSTREVAKDMDILRAALGEKKLDYLGKSYGTMIGATYADLFAANIGHMVLDGVMPPDLSMKDINEGQAKGFERALDAYLADCVKSSSCPLGTSAAAAKKKLSSWLDGLDAHPVIAHGDSRLDRLTQGWAVNGIANALYSQARWKSLSDALRGAMAGDGTQLLAQGKEYADRNDDGTYTSNIMQVITPVTCLDRPAPAGGASEFRKEAKEFAKVAPTWGPQLAWASASCDGWPVKPAVAPHAVKASGSAPIVVVGTTRDPATPYEWSEHLAAELENSRFVSWDGDGHTAYTRGSSCVDDAIDGYLVDGAQLPKKTTCAS